jgi:argininosuccinate lyase
VTSRETTQARRAQATPEKLRKWLKGLDDYHTALCKDIVTPALRAHLSHLAGPEGAAQVDARVEAIIATHLEQLRSDVERVLDANPEDFHAVLDRWLTRWEQDRPDQVADALLGEEIAHGRRA